MPPSGSDTLPSRPAIRIRPPRPPTMMRPSGRTSKQNAPLNPTATVSTSYAALFGGLGARVCPSHSGIGAYPSGAALPSSGLAGPTCAGGRRTARTGCATTSFAVNARQTAPVNTIERITCAPSIRKGSCRSQPEGPASGIEQPLRIELLLHRAHQRKAVAGRPPHVDERFERLGSADEDGAAAAGREARAKIFQHPRLSRGVAVDAQQQRADARAADHLPRLAGRREPRERGAQVLRQQRQLDDRAVVLPG